MIMNVLDDAIPFTQRRLGRVVWALPILLVIVGCAARARDSLLLAAGQAIEECAAADEHLEQSLLDHNKAERSALDSAFLADLKGLAEQHDGMVSYEDVDQAKALYDERLAAILQSREAIRKLFLSKQRTLRGALDLINKARSLSSLEQRALDEALGVIQETRERMEDQHRVEQSAPGHSQSTEPDR